MRYFKELVKTARTEGISFARGMDSGVSSRIREIFWSSVERNEIFVFMPSSEPVRDLDDEGSDLLSLDAPFEVFSMEMAGERQFITTPHHSDEIPVHVACIMYVENIPGFPRGGCFVYSIIQDIFGLGLLKPEWHRYREPRHVLYFEELNHGVGDIMAALLGRLRTERDGVELLEREVVMVPAGKDGGKKRPVPIRRIFHIAPKKQIVKYGSSSERKREINWTHSWPVRGTWVRLKEGKIGKNRKGEYVEAGRTWRKAHVKGDLEGPMISKVRIVDAPDDRV